MFGLVWIRFLRFDFFSRSKEEEYTVDNVQLSIVNDIDRGLACALDANLPVNAVLKDMGNGVMQLIAGPEDDNQRDNIAPSPSPMEDIADRFSKSGPMRRKKQLLKRRGTLMSTGNKLKETRKAEKHRLACRKSRRSKTFFKKAIELCQQNVEVLVLMKDAKREVCYWGSPGPMVNNLEQNKPILDKGNSIFKMQPSDFGIDASTLKEVATPTPRKRRGKVGSVVGEMCEMRVTDNETVITSSPSELAKKKGNASLKRAKQTLQIRKRIKMEEVGHDANALEVDILLPSTSVQKDDEDLGKTQYCETKTAAKSTSKKQDVVQVDTTSSTNVQEKDQDLGKAKCIEKKTIAKSTRKKQDVLGVDISSSPSEIAKKKGNASLKRAKQTLQIKKRIKLEEAAQEANAVEDITSPSSSVRQDLGKAKRCEKKTTAKSSSKKQVKNVEKKNQAKGKKTGGKMTVNVKKEDEAIVRRSTRKSSVKQEKDMVYI